MRRPSIILGVPLMDEDHAVLEHLLDQAAVADDAGLGDVLMRLEAETRALFAREEDMMRKAALTVLACHTVHHEMLLGQFRKARAMLESDDVPSLRSILVDLLPAAFSRHINTADRVAAGMLRTL